MDAPFTTSSLLRLAKRIAVIAIAVYVLHRVIGWATSVTEASGSMPLMLGLLALLLLTYALLMAIPFAPGIEIGVSLLVLRGAEIAPFVYGATLGGLTLAFLAGRYVPYAWLHGLFWDLRIMSACRLLERLAPLKHEERLTLLREHIPGSLQSLTGNGRYLMLAALLNLPGNAILGGGGGLAFIAGLSRVYTTSVTIAVMAAAVLPVPLMVWVYGSGFLERG